jgi:hypothetical protein
LAEGHGRREIVNPGGSPILLRNVEGTVRLKRTDAATLAVTALNINGVRTRRALSGAELIVLLPDAPYYLIEKLAEQ